MGSLFSKKKKEEVEVQEDCFEGIVTLVEVDDTDSDADNTYKLS